MDDEKPTVDVNCQDYRKTMELLGLRRQMEKGVSDPQACVDLRNRIEVLEKELAMD